MAAAGLALGVGFGSMFGFKMARDMRNAFPEGTAGPKVPQQQPSVVGTAPLASRQQQQVGGTFNLLRTASGKFKPSKLYAEEFEGHQVAPPMHDTYVRRTERLVETKQQESAQIMPDTLMGA